MEKRHRITDYYQDHKERWLKMRFSAQRNIPCNIETIRKQENRIDWEILSENPWLPTNKEFITAFADKWNWKKLSQTLSNMDNKIDFKYLIDLYNSKLNWEQICRGNNIAPQMVEQYSEFIDWNALSLNNVFDWSMEFLEKHQQRLNWKNLSKNMGEPSFLNGKNPPFNPKNTNETSAFFKYLLNQYHNKWDWNALSANCFMVFDIEILETFKESWNWMLLAENSSIDWSLSLVQQFLEYFPLLCPSTLESTHLWECLVNEAFELEYPDEKKSEIQRIIDLI